MTVLAKSPMTTGRPRSGPTAVGPTRAGAHRVIAGSAGRGAVVAPEAPLISRLRELQRLAGNRAVSGLLAQAHAANGHAGAIVLHGETVGQYDGGKSQVLGQRVRRAADCDCAEDEGPCLRATGTLRVRYNVDVQITMPDVPGGLTQCQERRVRDFLRTVLGPHEREHRRRMRTYNGTTRHRFSVSACGSDALTQAVQEHLQAHHDEEAAARQQSAQDLSDEIDPFNREIDLDCEDA